MSRASVLVVLWSFGCASDEDRAREALTAYNHVVLGAPAEDGTFPFTGSKGAGLCSGTVRVSSSSKNLEDRCVDALAPRLKPTSNLQPLATSCDSGDPRACVDLADRMFVGDDTAGDFDLLSALYVYGCDRDLRDGCVGHAKVLTSTGKNPHYGSVEDDLAAQAIYQKACAEGDLEGCSGASGLRWKGIKPGGPDHAGAMADLLHNCLAGWTADCGVVASHFKGDVEGYPESAVNEGLFHAIGCGRGDRWDCEALMRDSRTTETGWRAAAFRRHCELVADSCLDYGVEQFTGKKIPLDVPGAVATFTRLCDERGEMQACHNLGVIAAEGTAGTCDLASAEKRYRQACTGGHTGSCNNLALLVMSGDVKSMSEEEARAIFADLCAKGDAMGCRNVERFAVK